VLLLFEGVVLFEGVLFDGVLFDGFLLANLGLSFGATIFTAGEATCFARGLDFSTVNAFISLFLF